MPAPTGTHTSPRTPVPARQSPRHSRSPTFPLAIKVPTTRRLRVPQETSPPARLLSRTPLPFLCPEFREFLPLHIGNTARFLPQNSTHLQNQTQSSWPA